MRDGRILTTQIWPTVETDEKHFCTPLLPHQGIWKPRQIPNPDYFEDKEPFKMTPIVSETTVYSACMFASLIPSIMKKPTKSSECPTVFYSIYYMKQSGKSMWIYFIPECCWSGVVVHVGGYSLWQLHHHQWQVCSRPVGRADVSWCLWPTINPCQNVWDTFCLLCQIPAIIICMSRLQDLCLWKTLLGVKEGGGGGGGQ